MGSIAQETALVNTPEKVTPEKQEIISQNRKTIFGIWTPRLTTGRAVC
jgi:hypothetical protein